MGRLPVSYVQVDNHGITIFIQHTAVYTVHHEKVRAKVGKGSIKYSNRSHSIYLIEVYEYLKQ